MSQRRNSRSLWDLSHKVIQLLRVGRLQTIMRIPVLAGDSLSGSVSAFIRMNNLRRAVPFDLRADIWGFFVPYRFEYENLHDTLQAERDATSTEVPSLTLADHIPAVLVNGAATQTIPKHLVTDYLRVWAHYFRDPHDGNDPDAVPADTTLNRAYQTGAGTDDDPHVFHPEPRFGVRIGALKTFHSAMMQKPPRTESIPIDVVDASANSYALNVTKIPGAMAQWRQDTVQDWTAARFEDLHKALFGVSPPVELEKVPDYLGCSKRWLSSIDIDGTAGAELGDVVGKLTGAVTWKLPRKFFREHGTLWVMMGLRPHPVFTQAKHYLDNVSRFREFNSLWGTPVGAKELPRQVDLGDIFWDGGSSVTAGYMPSQQFYRTHPSYSHIDMSETDTGWEGRSTPTTGREMQYNPSYDDVFATLRGGHGKVFCLNRVQARRLVPDSMESIQGRP